ncbi:MAG: tRNA preQ1(34) S-adenosylmethionine ribosyltransferase-isomerase QueA [Candidatus Berkelbacteria bacterium]|nr:tRNA preQ1(34) S-adenosylmethionine ribosyltransferase-isomerase QueA [Candidatus Berkelbacteria bacterium]
MRTSNFEYSLPRELIAQESIKPRDRSRLLVLNRKTKKLIHDNFYNIGNYLKKGDIVVLNDTKVIPARLVGRREGEGRPIEVFLLKKINNFEWGCLLGGKRRKEVKEVGFENSSLKAKILKQNNDGTWKVKFNLMGNNFWQEVEKIGEVPTPPYIKGHKKFKKTKKDFYQTIFAREKGSVAAPTAGFHFTQKLVIELKKRGVKFVFVTLHVGLGTFAPIRAERVEDHQMHAEWFELNKSEANILNKAKESDHRIVAVGTTATRVLETCARTPLSPAPKKIKLIPYQGETKIFIKPGYKFKFIDALITNFHLPHSTPLLLASAFVESEKGIKKNEGIKILLKAYKEAIKKKYRFYSFGDAMLIF